MVMPTLDNFGQTRPVFIFVTPGNVTVVLELSKVVLYKLMSTYYNIFNWFGK